MPVRRVVASLLLATLAAAACKSSSPYATPSNVAVGTGLAVAAAAANRAVTHECWAACRPGTVCDKATGLCVEPGHRSGAHPRSGGGSGTPQMSVMAEAYPPGHEYEVPPLSVGDAGCAPIGVADGGVQGLVCEMDGGEAL